MLYRDNFTKKVCKFVEFHGKNIFGGHNMAVLYPNPCYNKKCYKGMVLSYHVVLECKLQNIRSQCKVLMNKYLHLSDNSM